MTTTTNRTTLANDVEAYAELSVSLHRALGVTRTSQHTVLIATRDVDTYVEVTVGNEFIIAETTRAFDGIDRELATVSIPIVEGSFGVFMALLPSLLQL